MMNNIEALSVALFSAGELATVPTVNGTGFRAPDTGVEILEPGRVPSRPSSFTETYTSKGGKTCPGNVRF
ncbi:MAG: hypothetical protein OES18_11660 [Deltaproteobacteria bacterium]|nr:hypothetical protein [Deltaproteobacteria bacterium]